ncbi:MAG: glutaredoxin 3 [Hyphomonadaceae bacterium]
MAKVTIYTRDFCGYCASALSLLRAKGADFHEIEAGYDPALRREMIQRSGGGATFPQIFIGERHIGGSDDLHALDDSGELDALLAAP